MSKNQKNNWNFSGDFVTVGCVFLFPDPTKLFETRSFCGSQG